MNRMKRAMSLIVPGPRPGDLFGVDVVGGDRHLREVVEQVVGQDLDRRHRQERQEGAGAQDAEHVAEVRAGAHADVFEDVGEDLAAFHHAFLEHQQALLQQDDVGGFLGDVHGRSRPRCRRRRPAGRGRR